MGKIIALSLLCLTLQNGNEIQLCRVSQITQNEVYVVTPNGNEYSFETDGCTDCTVGSYWACEFNSEMEIVDVR